MRSASHHHHHRSKWRRFLDRIRIPAMVVGGAVILGLFVVYVLDGLFR